MRPRLLFPLRVGVVLLLLAMASTGAQAQSCPAPVLGAVSGGSAGACGSVLAPGTSCSINCTRGYQLQGTPYVCSAAGALTGGPQSCKSALYYGKITPGQVFTVGVTAGLMWAFPCTPDESDCFPGQSYSWNRHAVSNFRISMLTASNALVKHVYGPVNDYTAGANELWPDWLSYTMPMEPGQYYMQAFTNNIPFGDPLPFTVVVPASCSLASVLASLPPNIQRGNCPDTLPAGSSCTLACASAYQVLTGANYSCSSSSGELSGGQTCADPVCTQTGPGREVVVPVLGMRYTGPMAAALGSVISVSAQVPYPGPGLTGDATSVVGSLAFEGPGVVPCTVSTAVVGTDSTAQCFLAAPVLSNSGSNDTFPLTASFVYQKDWCTKFVGSVTSNLKLVDLARVQTVADSAWAGVAAEVGRASAAEATLRTDLTTEATARAQSDASLSTAVLNETARAVAAERVLNFNLSLVSSRVGVLEVAEPSFLFRGLQSGLEVAYPKGQQPGVGIASMLNYRLSFDAPLSERGSAIRYNSTSGVVSLVQPGSYRLDAFVHLYTPQGASAVGTGVVAWMTVESTPKPIGANILNPNAAGVPQGTVGDNTFVSTLLTVPSGTSPAAPFNVQCVLVSMNQRKNQVTDASVISITKLK